MNSTIGKIFKIFWDFFSIKSRMFIRIKKKNLDCQGEENLNL